VEVAPGGQLTPGSAVKPWLGLLVRTVGGTMIGVAVAGVVVGGLLAVFDADPAGRLGGAVFAGVGLAAGVAGRATRRAGRALGPPPEALLLTAGLVRPLALRLTMAGAGAGLIALGVATVQALPDRLVVVALGALLLALSALVVITDIRLRRWRVWSTGPPPVAAPGPGGRPTGTEWAVAVVLNTFTATMLVTGVLAVRSDGDAELLATAVLCAVVVLFPTVGAIVRWWSGR
jgi:hypothetical protein